MTEFELKPALKSKKTPGLAITTPLWVKDYLGLALIGLALIGAINFYANEPYQLQILCSIGVAIIVATGLNLVVGYIGQASLGHAGLVALGGYTVGIVMGRITAKTNWIDYLYVRNVNSFTSDEKRDPAQAIALRNEALVNTESLLTILLFAAIALTVVFGVFFYWRWKKTSRNAGKVLPHFWNNPAFMKQLARLILIIGVGGGVLLYLLTAISQAGNAPGKPREGFSWVIFAAWGAVFLLVYYLAWATYRRASEDSGRLRAGFWDKPHTMWLCFLASVISGGFIAVALTLLLFLGLPILQNFWVCIFLAAAVTAFFGYILALPTLRVKGPYLSMVTIAFGVIVYEVVNSTTLQPIMGAQSGLSRIPRPITPRNPNTGLIYPALDKQTDNQELFWTAIIIATTALVIIYMLRSLIRSRWGRSLIAIRENEIGAGSVGIHVTRTKTLAFVVSAAISGIGGALLGYSFGTIDPTISLFSASVGYVTMLILGGSGTLYGPIIGATLITIIPEFLKNISEDKVRAGYVFAFDGLNGYLTPVLLALLLVGYGVARLVRKDRRLTAIFGWLAGGIVILNSYEIFKSLTNALGSINGVGFPRTSFEATDWLLIVLFYAVIIAGFSIAPAMARRVGIRLIAAAGILFIPTFFKLGYGFARGDDAPTFQAVTTLLSMYSALLLYFLYLVPAGIGGVIGQLIDRFFPTLHKEGLKPVAVESPGDTIYKEERLLVKPDPSPGINSNGPVALLKVAKISRNFKGLRAVDEVEMVLYRKKIHALIGPNGAGKTTVLNLISGLYPVSSGEILFNGERIDGIKPYRIAEAGISRTFQNLQIFGDMTAIENVMVGLHLYTRQGFWASLLGLPRVRAEEKRVGGLALQLLAFVGLSHRAYSKARDLPYGHQRLLEIARALAVKPQLLLLDEPAAGLNPHEVDEMVKLIRKIKDTGTTVLLIEHHMDLVMEISDEITVLDYGRKIEEGDPVTVQMSDRVKEAYFGPEVVLNA